MIYLDNAATTEVSSEVLVQMMPYFINEFYNPSSKYSEGVKIKNVLDESRQIVAESIGAKADEIYFTSGGSESNCWAIQGFVNFNRDKYKPVLIVTSVIEHKSILKCVESIYDKKLIQTCYVHVDSKGFVKLKELESILSGNKGSKNILVSIQFANNEIGTIQHIKKISEICHKYHAVFHTDAVQAYGQVDCNVKALDIDMLSVSGHKLGVPKGIGFLYIKQGIQIKPLIYGTQNNGMRGGTENIPYIVGMAVAAKGVINKDYVSKSNNCKEVRDYAIQKLTDKFHVTLNGDSVNRLPNNINVTFPNSVTGESLIFMLDTSGIQISAGSACNSYIDLPSHVLKAIKLSDSDAMRTIRITLPEYITTEMIDVVIKEIEKCVTIITM